MLVGAAADRWDVDPTDCETGDGFVMNRGRTFTFGELAEEAADRTPPLNPQLRTATKGRLIGQPLPRLDGPAKADGGWRFAGDVRLPACSLPPFGLRHRVAGCELSTATRSHPCTGSGMFRRAKAGWRSWPKLVGSRAGR